MTWVDEMKEDIAAVAFPYYRLQEGDQIYFETDYDSGWSEYTPGAGFEATVQIIRTEEYTYQERVPVRTIVGGELPAPFESHEPPTVTKKGFRKKVICVRHFKESEFPEFFVDVMAKATERGTTHPAS